MTDLVVYGASYCRACNELKKFLTNSGVSFVYKDVSENSVMDELMKYPFMKSGIKSIPITVRYDGKYLTGFSVNEMKELIASVR